MIRLYATIFVIILASISFASESIFKPNLVELTITETSNKKVAEVKVTKDQNGFFIIDKNLPGRLVESKKIKDSILLQFLNDYDAEFSVSTIQSDITFCSKNNYTITLKYDSGTHKIKKCFSEDPKKHRDLFLISNLLKSLCYY